jgi:hypothetical protein
MSMIGQALAGERPKIGEWVRHMPVPTRKPPEAQDIPQAGGGRTELEKNTVRPKHYGSKSGQDVIDVAEDFGIADNAYKFNMLKYLLRGGKKPGNSELQDMTKIKVYLERYIEKLSRGE